MSVWNKLDPSLASIYSDYLESRRRRDDSAAESDSPGEQQINVVVQFKGNLDEIRDLGFRALASTEKGRASGTLDLSKLERVAAHADVLKLSFGRRPRVTLDVSIPRIGANELWTRTGDVFSGANGAGVIVAIIDTGIDYQHPYFLKTTSPRTTRILRIWDTGLTPQGTESSPPLARLSNPFNSYGVEYDEETINLALQGDDSQVRSRDCSGHGTHVASIAAGSGRDRYQFIGVAPAADIIAVKLLNPETEPLIDGSAAAWIMRFQDAVNYVLNTVREDFGNRPVVINCSFGSETGPHDGFTEQENWLTTTFEGAVGKVIVFSAGNAGAKNQHARLEFEPPGRRTFDIQLELYDTRTNREDMDLCRPEDPTGRLDVDLFYPATAGTLSASLLIPHDPEGPLNAPALGEEPARREVAGRLVQILHSEDFQTLGSGVTVRRNVLRIEINPDEIKNHRTGLYAFNVSASAALTAHLWCGQMGYDHGIRIDSSAPDGVWIEDRYLIGPSKGARNTITVASFSPETDEMPVVPSSSRGPLVTYDTSVGLPAQPAKPDIAAPGYRIDAAKSRDSEPRQKKKRDPTIQLGGTSMAAPHVAGAVALLLQKNPTLTLAQIREALGHVQLGSVASNDAVGLGRLDVKDAFDNTPSA